MLCKMEFIDLGLVWVYRSKVWGELVDQLLVPQPFRCMVLGLSHNDPLGDHLGAEKTEAQITDQFFWPRVVKQYCSSCPTCQLTAPVSHLRNPLLPMLFIQVPFEHIVMILMGPLVKSAQGNQYSLVVLNYAIRYGEVVSLREKSYKAISGVLFKMFSRTGFPKEILTDQGFPFMSKMMENLCKLFQINNCVPLALIPWQTDWLQGSIYAQEGGTKT